MNAFDVAINSLFQDRNLVTQALYYPICSKEKKIAVVAHRPDDFHAIGDSIIAIPTLVVDVALSACPNIVPGEKFTIYGKTFVVQGEPKRDSNNLTARVQLCES